MGDVCVRAVRKGQDRGDTNDSNRPRERGHQGTALFRHQVIEGQGKRGQESHRGAAHRLGLANFFGTRDERTRVGDHFTIRELDNAGRVLVRKLRVVGHHNDQTVLGDIAEEVHDLDTGLGVKSAGRFIGQENFRIVDERSSNSDALHLATRKL